jgi:hypothetical protein
MNNIYIYIQVFTNKKNVVQVRFKNSYPNFEQKSSDSNKIVLK